MTAEGATWTTLAPDERMARWRDGSLPLSPCWQAFGVRPLSIDHGRAHVALSIGPRILRAGSLPAGMLGLLGDVVLGVAATLTLDVPTPLVTVTMLVEIAASQLPNEGTLHAFASHIGTRGRQILLAGEVLDSADLLVARISAWYVEVPGRAPRPTLDVAEATATAEDIDGLLASPTIGIERPGLARMTVVPARHMANPHGTLHGGVGIVLADTVAAAAVESATGHSGYLPLTMACSYLRTAGGDDQPVAIEAEVRKPGRTVSSVEAVVQTADGRPALVVSIDANTFA